MKNFVLVFCLLLSIATIYADLLGAYVKYSGDVFIKCANEIGMAEKDPRAIFENDAKLEKVSCLRACILKIMGSMENSKLNKEQILQFSQKVHAENPEVYRKIEPALSDCVGKVENIADECNKAHAYVNCVMDNQ